MSIILRTNKGSALTYDEMDRNQSQFFYSSSISPDGTKLRLHYTGSDTLDLPGEDYGPTRYQEILFPNIDLEVPEAAAAGNNTQIQFNDNGVFGADSLFVFEKIKNTVGIGTANPIDRLDIAGAASQTAAISLRGYAAGSGNQKQAKINFYEGNTYLGRLGRTDGDNQNIYLTNNYALNARDYGKVHISIGADGDDDAIVAATFTRNSGTSKLGVGTKDPNRAGTFVGGTGIGISSTSANTEQSILTPIPSTIFNSTTNGLKDLIPNNSDSSGLLIASPNDVNGGNIVVAINTDTTNKNEGFNIINAYEGVYTNSTTIASFQASGKVGINTNYPSDVGLTVAGNISGSGTLQVGTIATGTADSTSALVATTNGLVQKIAAAPVPVGGIIMWSGAIASIPDGWALCDGSNGTPNLKDRFVIGAGNSWDPDDTGGAATHTHGGGFTGATTLTTAQIPSHNHTYLDVTYSEVNGHKPAGNQIGSNDTDGDNGFYYRKRNGSVSAGVPTVNDRPLTDSTGGGNGHNHSIGVQNHLPPYYALAFIMYVGS